jgi:hypothetical protein
MPILRLCVDVFRTAYALLQKLSIPSYSYCPEDGTEQLIFENGTFYPSSVCAICAWTFSEIVDFTEENSSTVTVTFPP